VGLGIHMLAESTRRGIFGRVRAADSVRRLAKELHSAAVRTFPQLGPYVLVAPGEDDELLVRPYHTAEDFLAAACTAVVWAYEVGDSDEWTTICDQPGPGYWWGTGERFHSPQ
jgi:hypothetical protein